MKFIFPVLLIAVTSSCNSSKNKTETPVNTTGAQAEIKPVPVFDKLVGVWRHESGKSFERWIKNSDDSYRTAGFSLKGTDTVWNEQGNVYKENDKWIFENSVTGQNEGKAVKFTSTILNDNTVQFSNPAHDFPTDINYTLADASILNAFIVGPNGQGGKDTIPFNFTRVK